MQMSLASHRCCARLKILKQAWLFSATHIITLSGSCIHRKAINKDKHLSSGWYPIYGQECYITWSHNDIPFLVRYPSSGVLPSRQQSSVSRLPGTPPPSVYQVTQSTALQAAERYVKQRVL